MKNIHQWCLWIAACAILAAFAACVPLSEAPFAESEKRSGEGGALGGSGTGSAGASGQAGSGSYDCRPEANCRCSSCMEICECNDIDRNTCKQLCDYENGTGGTAGAGGTATGGAANCVHCIPGDLAACTCATGLNGLSICSNDGCSYSTCQCMPRTCEPGAEEACACPLGNMGAHACVTDGTRWGECQCTVPDTNFSCDPGAVRQCSCPGGFMSSQVCLADGSQWGACLGCVAINEQTPIPGNQTCQPGRQQACQCTNGTFGIHICNVIGTGWSDCSACGMGSTPPTGTPTLCVPNTSQACQCTSGGTGTRTCSTDGNSWSTCINCTLPTGGTGTAPSTYYTAVTYTCTTNGSVARDAYEILHEAADTYGNIYPRTNPYGALGGITTGTLSHTNFFAWGIALDGPNSKPSCEANDTGIIHCTVHVPAGAIVKYNGHYYNANAANSESWNCATSSGMTNGSCIVQNAVNNATLQQFTESYPLPNGTSICRYRYTAPY